MSRKRHTDSQTVSLFASNPQDQGTAAGWTVRSSGRELSLRTVCSPAFRAQNPSNGCTHDGVRSRVRGQLRARLLTTRCGWCCFLQWSALHWPSLSEGILAVHTVRLPSPARTATPLPAGGPSAQYLNSITTRPNTRCAACTKKCAAPSATPNRSSRMLARTALIVMPISTAANLARTAPSAIPS